jgi:hypothetical protein
MLCIIPQCVCLYASYERQNKWQFFSLHNANRLVLVQDTVSFYTNLSVVSHLKWVSRPFFYDTLSYYLKMLMSKLIFSVLIQFYFFVFIGISTLYRYMFRHALSQSDEMQILNKGFE